MKYKLGVRRLGESDIGVECPVLPEPEDFQMYLNAFVEEINGLDVVVNAEPSGESIVIELESEADVPTLHRSVRDAYQNFSQYFATTGFKIAS